MSLLVGHDGDATAADGDDDVAGVDERADGWFLDNALRQRRGDDAPPATPGIFVAVPAVDLDASLRVLFAHERADRLGWVLEGGVVGVDFGLGDDGCYRLVDTHVEEDVLQALLESVADGPLRVRAANVQRHFVQLVRGQFTTAQDEADLRAVAVGHGNVPAGLDHLGDVDGRLIGRVVLVFHRLVLLVLDQGVAADGDDGEFLGHGFFSCGKWK